MSKNNQLPPELVEKIKNVRQETGFGDGFHVSDVLGNRAVDEIAQIAVEYADEELKPIIAQNNHLIEKNQRLVSERLKAEKQRNELLEALKRTKNIFGKQVFNGCDSKKWERFENGNGREVGKQMDECLEDIDELIQKYDVKHD